GAETEVGARVRGARRRAATPSPFSERSFLMFPFRSGKTSSRKAHPAPRIEKPRRRRLPVSLERLEDRILLTAPPLALADPSLYGIGGLKASFAPSISADGQLIAFASDADNLVPNDANGLTDSFVFNRATGTISLVSVGLSGNAAGSDSSPVVSPDGRYV